MPGVLKRWNGTEWVSQSIVAPSGDGGGPLQNLHIESRSSHYKMADHTMQAMDKGTFIPLAEEVLVEVSYSGLVSGMGHISSFLAWNQVVAPGTDLMTGRGFEVGAFIPDTQYETIGPSAGPGSTGQTRRKLKLTGLTPGEPVTWELVVGATGYYEEFTDLNVPVDLAISYWQGNWKLFVTSFSDNLVKVYDPGNRVSNGGITEEIAEWAGHSGPYGIAIHPTDFSRVYIGRYSANQVVECDTETGAVLRTFSVDTPQYMIVSEDGTKLFVGNGLTTVIPITLSSGTVGSAISVGAGGGTMKLTAIGSYIYVPCVTATRVDRIAVSDHTITSLATNGPLPVRIAPNPADPSLAWVLERTPAKAREIDLDSFIYSGREVTGLGGSPNDMGVSPSGRSMVQVSHTKLLETFVIPGKGVVYEFAGGEGSRIVIDTYGDLWILEQARNTLKHFHCGILEIDPDDQFWGGYSDFMVQPASL